MQAKADTNSLSIQVFDSTGRPVWSMECFNRVHFWYVVHCLERMIGGERIDDSAFRVLN